MSTDNTTSNNTITPVVYLNNEEIQHEEVPLEISEAEICPHCKEELTFEQVKHVVPNANEVLTNKILVYLNKYRKDYKLDTCLRKAHFIAQVGAEMGFLAKNMKEGTMYSHTSLFSTFKNYFKKKQIIDNTILDSLEEHLTSIFKITDKDGTDIAKTNAELKVMLKTNNVEIDVAELYGHRKIDEKILKTISEKVINNKGEEIEEVKYNIVILKRSEHFGIETLSRAYASRMKNNDELSREGYMYSGKGIKQLTGKKNYESFSKYRKDNPWPDDPEGYIDFSEITDKVNLKGNFDKLADSDEVIYGVQSALWFFVEGNAFDDKYPVDWADNDNARRVSYVINGGWNGIKKRNENTLKARGENGFKVYKHHELFYKNGTDEEKEEVTEILTQVSTDSFVDIWDEVEKKNVSYNLKDDNAALLLSNLTALEKMESKGLQLEVDLKLDLKPIN